MLDQELIAYLDRRFTETREQLNSFQSAVEGRFVGVEQRLDEHDREFAQARLDRKSLREELVRRIGVVEEQLREEVQIVAEGVGTMDEKLDRFREETTHEFGETRAMIRLSYNELDRRLRSLETRTEDLDVRLRRLETADA